MDNSAVTPSGNPVVTFFGEIKNEQEKTFETLKDKEQDWADFYKSGYFFLVKEYIEHLLEALDELEGQAFENGADLQEIGLRRAVNRLTKANLLSLIRKVESTRDARSNPGGASKEPTVS